MLLSSITISGAGRFTAPHRIAGLQPGVNVLAAPNETGKSTFMSALRLAMFAPFKTASQKLLGRLPSESVALPLHVAVEFSLNGHAWRLDKQFVKAAHARLYCDGGLVADSQDADARLWSMLGIDGADGRHFEMLWLEQGRSIELPTVAQSALQGFSAAVEQALGSVVDGGPARDLWAELDDALKPFLTSSGGIKKGSQLEVLISGVAGMEAAAAALEQKIAAVDRQRGELADVRARQAGFTRTGIAADLARALESATQALTAAQGRAGERAVLERNLAAAQSILNKAQSDLEEAHNARQELIGLVAEVEAAALGLAVARTAHDELAAQSAAQAKSDGLKARRESLEADLRLAALRKSWANAQASLPGLQASKAREAEVKEALANATGQLAAMPALTQADLDQLGAAELAVIKAEAAAGAGRAHVTVTALGKAAVAIDGSVLGAEPARFSLDQPTRIRVDGVIEVAIDPPAAPGALEERLAIARGSLASGLSDLSLTSLDEAREVFEKRRDLQRIVDDSRRDLAAFGSGMISASANLDQCQSQIAALEAQLDSLANDWREAPALDDARIAADLETVVQSLLEAEADASAAEAALGASRGRLDQARILLDTRSEILSRLRARRDETGLDILAGEASKRLEAAQAGLAQAKAALASHDHLHDGAPSLEQLEIARQRAGDAQANHAREAARLNERRIELEAILRNGGHDGLDEDLAELQGRLELERRERNRVQARVDGLVLLRARVAAALEAEQTRLAGPVSAALAPYLGMVFPGARVSFDHAFSPTALGRPATGSGVAPEAFEILSMGTQEQIGILTRLAMADVLSSNGQAWPVILDDALVYADDARIQQLFDALTLAGRSRQLIVLTCKENAFAHLGGNRVTIEPVARDELKA